ncbi:hypothetical protein W02_16030 [Nitrospira sp. KM1]|uniref:polysaccharide deacetylase family protein n=1 Tax=Nitrospira sp. KM1 TaxID=1936990 RepID=UPI0013A76C5C|nr:polysaccharide deacetylase family protein [Nitrospira sp. KM1]BCA54463.1 hypothetical protein W02_16030 [Nitrospira sp. KM1]
MSLGAIRQIALRFRNRFRSKALILLYHRTSEVETDPQLLSVTPKHFSDHLAHLVKRYSVMSLDELVCARLARRDIPDRTIAVTFDDGYADNLTEAMPLLERFNVPATVFVAGLAFDDQPFWWDELESIFLRPSTLPSAFNLRVGSVDCRRELNSAAQYREAEFARYRNWDVLNPDAPTPRHALYRDLCVMLKQASPSQRSAAMRTIREWSGRSNTRYRGHRRLTAREIKDLASGYVVRVGAHTVSHAALATLSLQEQRKEIFDSRDDLEKILGEAPKSFAYPFGCKTDYSSDTVSLVRSAGFELACSNYPGIVTAGVDKYQLPRMIVRNWSQDIFATKVNSWFEEGV